VAGSPCPDDGRVCTTDLCDGAGTCVHAVADAGTACRPAVDQCDVPESCDGVGLDCPPDAFASSTVVCRSAAGVCDLPESCTGTGPACPPDLKRTDPCRPASGPCDIAESCDGVHNDCPADASQPNGTHCDDGNACTRTDSCQAGVCVGGNPVVCTPSDGCHVAGVCAPSTGVCSNPTRPDNAPCDDGNACTTADSCQTGVCQGLPVAGCCLHDSDCDDGLACTEDRCVGNACTHVAHDDRCGPALECALSMCLPADATADARGCVSHDVNDGGYCTDDLDPCTIDTCGGGACRHIPDGSGATCAQLVAPYRTLVGLGGLAVTAQGELSAALAGCPTGAGGTACDLVPGDEATRLISLIDAAHSDFGAAALALAGRVTGAASLDPTVRARLAVGLISGTPGELRAFLATLTAMRRQHGVQRTFAQDRRAEALRLLTTTGTVRRQLRRVLVRRGTFTR
jgi:hypothetical protein